MSLVPHLPSGCCTEPPRALDVADVGTSGGTRRACVVFAFAIAASLMGCRGGPSAASRTSDESRALADQARAAEAAGNLDEASALYSSAVRKCPADSGLHRDLARVLVQRGDSRAAIDQLRRAVARTPDDISCYVQLADTLFREGAVQDAEPPLNLALGINPACADALLLKGKVAEARQQDDVALEFYFRVLSLQPDHVDARLSAAKALVRESRCECAASMLRAVVACPASTSQQQADARRTLAQIYLRDHRWEDAARELAAAAGGRDDAITDDWYRMAVAAHTAGETSFARTSVDEVLRRDGSHPGARELSQVLTASAEHGSHAAPVRLHHAISEVEARVEASRLNHPEL